MHFFFFKLSYYQQMVISLAAKNYAMVMETHVIEHIYYDLINVITLTASKGIVTAKYCL